MYKVLSSLKHNGQRYQVGDQLLESEITHSQARRLMEQGVLETQKESGEQTAPAADNVAPVAPAAPAVADPAEPQGEMDGGLRYFEDEAGVTATDDVETPFSQLDQSKAGHGADRVAAFNDWNAKRNQTTNQPSADEIQAAADNVDGRS